jgi:hypothetical protein
MNTFSVRSRHRYDHAAATPPELTLRIRVYLFRGRLDRQLASGHDSEESAALALRARQLSSPRARAQVASNLRGVVDYADSHESRRAISAVVIETGAVRRAREAIIGLAERLEASAPVHPAGVALAEVLLTDGRSPLFNPNPEQTIAEAVRRVQAALRPTLPRSGFAPTAR